MSHPIVTEMVVTARENRIAQNIVADSGAIEVRGETNIRRLEWFNKFRFMQASRRLDFDDAELQDKINRALDESFNLQKNSPPLPLGYRDRGYEEALAKIWKKHLRGTGWTEEDIDRELDRR